MSSLREIIVVTRMNLRNLPQRLGSSFVVIIGNVGVVAVLVSVLAMAVGFKHTIETTGRADRAIIMRGGANSELTSVLGRDSAQVITDAQQIKRDASGAKIVSAELVLSVDMTQKSNGSHANVTLRGIGPAGQEVRPEIHIIEGRNFQPGKQEIVVGVAVQKQFTGLTVGEHVNFGGGDWLVTGAFTSNGDLHESEVFADVASVAGAYRRRSYNSITALLERSDAFDEFKADLTANPSLTVDVVRETDYYAGLSQELTKLLTQVGWLVGGIMSIGAIFGALNSIYAAVGSRRVEIATLRAMGFSAESVVVSIIVEALILALSGGIFGAALAWTIFNGNAVNTLGGSNTQVVFHLMVTPLLISLGLLIAVAIGLVGGLIPAARAARLPVATALRGL
jgi:putative ABC transport system permease protein